ncbi:hypothetical protein [Methylomonas rivi]|uniref:Zorya protein ZorC EH domain-containing protein n=1 Tax=Methylomonas rivi TaxID=2952226 RepID=A0ABT1U6I7_9GAMM|nr:hypothetical protein [Methylomonas sp. WSC-6]MCQ8129473.1 hypothetical protein [Methylomonas sp. WSC-6]
MGRTPSHQIAILDILDWLYFNQVLVFSVYSQTDREWLKRIVDYVSHSVSETGAVGSEAEYMKHCVLCLLEIFLADDMEKFKEKLRTLDLDIAGEHPAGIEADTAHRIDEHRRNFFAGYVIAVGRMAHGESINLAAEIAISLQEQFCDAPALVRYRLAERCMAYEYKKAPLDFFTWLAELQVIRCAKYQSKKLTTPLPELVITRIGLLCEFEMLRGHIGRTCGVPNMAEIMIKGKTEKLPETVTEQLLKNKHQFEKLTYTESLRKSWLTFVINRRLDSAYVTYFYAQVSHYFHRIRLWQGTQASWLGTLGGFIVEMRKSHTYPDRPIYVEINNKGTITDDISTLLRERGFSINGRGLYEHHNRFAKEIKNKVLFYYTMLDIAKVAPPPENDDMFYYNVVSLHHRLNEVKPSSISCK